MIELTSIYLGLTQLMSGSSDSNSHWFGFPRSDYPAGDYHKMSQDVFAENPVNQCHQCFEDYASLSLLFRFLDYSC